MAPATENDWESTQEYGLLTLRLLAMADSMRTKLISLLLCGARLICWSSSIEVVMVICVWIASHLHWGCWIVILGDIIYLSKG